MTATATSPHGLHSTRWIFEQVGHAACSCGALPDRPCTCGHGNCHLARFARAAQEHRISYRDCASLIPDGDGFAGSTVILNPEATP